MIDSVIDNNINISKYNPLAGSNFVNLLKELDHPREGLISIQNMNNSESSKWCIVKHLHPGDHHLARLEIFMKYEKMNRILQTLNFLPKLKTFSKSRNRIPFTVVFLFMKIREKPPIYISNNYYEDKHNDLLLIWEKDRKHYVLIKDFNIFMYDYTLNLRKNIFTVIVYKLSVQKKY